MTYCTDMSLAPRDRNILIKTMTVGYHNSEWFRKAPHNYRQKPDGWYPTGYKWVEARWREAQGGSDAQFAEWCGNLKTHTTSTLLPVAWSELPEGDEFLPIPKERIS